MEYSGAKAMCLRSLVGRVTFFRFSVLEQKCADFCSRNAVAQKPCASGSLWNVVTISDSVFCNKLVPLFLHGIQWRKSHVPQEPCEWGNISKVGVPKAILEQKSTVICSWNTLTQKPCASEAL